MDAVYGNDFSAVMAADLAERRARDARRAQALQTLLGSIANLGQQGQWNRNFQYRQQQDATENALRRRALAETELRSEEAARLRERQLKLSEDYYKLDQARQNQQAGMPTAAESAFLRRQAEAAAGSGMFDPRAFPKLTPEETEALKGINDTVRGQAESEHAQLQGVADLLNKQRRLQIQLKELDDERNKQSPYWRRPSTINPLGRVGDWLAKFNPLLKSANVDEVAQANAEDRTRFTAEKSAVDSQITALRQDKRLMSNFEIDPKTGEYRVKGGDLPWRQRRALPAPTQAPARQAAPEVTLPNGKKVDAGFVQQWQALVDQGVPPAQAVSMVRANRAQQLVIGQP